AWPASATQTRAVIPQLLAGSSGNGNQASIFMAFQKPEQFSGGNRGNSNENLRKLKTDAFGILNA
ncbi:MAG: hypothetical protein Q7U75_09475, partial [Desulfobacterales bacterium]|nr:hypothetical protein [Desulfobacterales bacterium]